MRHPSIVVCVFLIDVFAPTVLHKLLFYVLTLDSEILLFNLIYRHTEHLSHLCFCLFPFHNSITRKFDSRQSRVLSFPSKLQFCI